MMMMTQVVSVLNLYHTDAGGRSSQELCKLMNKVAGNREMFDENSTPGS